MPPTQDAPTIDDPTGAFDWPGPPVPSPDPPRPTHVVRMRRVSVPGRATVRFVAVCAVVVATLLVTTLVMTAQLTVGWQVVAYGSLVVVLSAALRPMVAPDPPRTR